MPLRILVTGATGMLGHAILQTWSRRFELFSTAQRSIDSSFLYGSSFCEFSLASKDFCQLKAYCSPDIIVNCAAITDHGICESHPEHAYMINGEAPAKLAQAFPSAYIIHVSTDAVFGEGAIFPGEDIQPAPFSVYGNSKFQGEVLLLSEQADAIVLRTTIVGIGGRRRSPSLVEWMYSSLLSGNKLNLYTDALFTPINVWDFISILEWCIESRPTGVLHAAGAERISKHDFGVLFAQQAGLDVSLIHPAFLVETMNGVGRRTDQSISSNKLERLRGVALPGAYECVAGIVRKL